MCTRYTLTPPPALLSKRFGLSPESLHQIDYQPRYNLAPTDSAPVIVATDAGREVVSMTFGLIPSWAKDAKVATQMLNARSETVSEKAAFCGAFQRRRCLIPADGFYEWIKDGKLRIPYHITLKEGELFAFAGLWESWRRPDGKDHLSFAILTTEANSLLAPIHNRMPVILTEEEERLWLAPYVTEEKTLKPLLKSFPAGKMQTVRVSRYVNKAGNEGPECVRPEKSETEETLL